MSLASQLEKRKKNEKVFLDNQYPIADIDSLKTTEYSDKFVIEFKPTNNCNYSCSYCYFYETGAKGMTQEIFNGVIDLFKSDNSPYKDIISNFNEVFIFIYGGEPLLHKNIIDYCVELNTIHPKCSFLIQTNGSPWNIEKYKKACDTFDEHNLNYTFSFSWHNEFVNKTDFLKKVDFLRSRGVFDTITYMTTLATVKTDSVIIKSLKYLGYPVYVRTILQESIEFKNNQYYDMITRSDNQPFIINKNGVEINKSFEELTTEGYLNFYGFNCLAGINSVQITPEGDIYRCDLDGLYGTNKIANVLDKKISLPQNLKCPHKFCSIYFSDKWKSND